MSDTIPTFTSPAAKRFNAKHAARVTEPGIPQAAIESFPGLATDPAGFQFAEAVFELQRIFGITMDGCLGMQTYKTLLCEFDCVEDDAPYVVFGVRRISLPNADYRVVNFDQPGGLDLHAAGYFSDRRAPAERMILHWGGFDPQSLHNIMSGPRKVSTHFGIGLDDANQATVYQYLDLKHKAWHAGEHNEGSVGIDICQQPVYKHIGMYQKRGYHVRRGHNTTGRGNKNVISLDPRISDVTNKFVSDLADALGWQLSSPSGHDVVSDTAPYTVLGHHHVSANKWDIAPWWDTIFGGGALS
jgi:hypothetical protein